MSAQHEPTDRTRDLVQALAVAGFTQERTAAALGVDTKTLRRHYRSELDTALAETVGAVSQGLVRAALDGNTTAAIFFLKTRAGWRETTRTELTGADGGPVESKGAAVEKIAGILSRIAERERHAGNTGEP